MAEPGNKNLGREDQIDQRYEDGFNSRNLQNAENSAGQDYGLSNRQQQALDKKLASADEQLKNYTPGSSDIDDVRQREAALTSGLYVGKGSEERKETVSLKTVLKKKGPMAAIFAGLLGMPTIIAIIFSPALVLQQLAETMTGKFNDQLAALDVRSTMLLKKKYGSKLTKGTCGTRVTIRCKYQSIRENSGLAKRLKNAGVEIRGNKSIVPGRIKPTEFVFEGKVIPAKNLLKEAVKDPALRSALRKGYDPLYAGFSDKVAAKVRAKVGVKRSSNVKSSTTPEEMDEDLKETASGENMIPDDAEKLTPVKDGDGNITGYEDADGNSYGVEEGEARNNRLSELQGRDNLAKKASKTVLKSTLKGALTSTAFGAGAVDSACSAWVLIRVAGFAAKYYQQLQLIRYSYEFMKVAHEQKEGTLTAEKMTHFANKLTQTNSEGKGALDSDGYRFAAYGDAFNADNFDTGDGKGLSEAEKEAETEKITLQNETARYVNGQLVGKSLMAKIAGAVTGGGTGTKAADEVCKFTKSWQGQTLVFGLAIAGAVAAFFSGGATLSVGIVAQAAVSVAISVAFSLLQPKLIDMAKGEVIKGDENGNETGNAITSGMGGYNANTAPGRGLRASTVDSYTAYNKAAQQVAARQAEIDRSELSPFDPSNKNTFLGSIVGVIIPYTSKMQTAGAIGLSASSLVRSTLGSIGLSGTAYAGDSEKDQFSQCNDPEYNDRNMAADPFCNPRYEADLTTDPEVVLDYMIDGGYITEDDETPQGEYAEYITRCFDRKTSIGDEFNDPTTGEEGNGDPGDDCVVGAGGSNEKRNRMFSSFYIDTSINEGFDEDFSSSGVSLEAGATFRVATFNILHTPDSFGDCTWQCRLQRSVKTLTDNKIDIAGLQEMREGQQKLFPDYAGSVYDKYPAVITNGREANENPESVVVWDKTKFELIEGRQKPIKYEGARKVNIVKLRYIENGANGPELYVMNTHDPIDKRADSDGGPQNRLHNTQLYYETIKNELTDAPVVMVGDFNSKMTVEASGNKPVGNLRSNLAYCVMTKDSVTIHASDAQQGKGGDCPSEKDVLGNNPIDHIFISPIMTADGYTQLPDRTNGSDHPTIFADLTIPGAAENSGQGSTFIIGTYNQKCCRSKGMTEQKQKLAAQIMVDKKMDIIGTQETSNPKFSTYKSYLTPRGYGVYPTYAGPNQTCMNAQAIFYNKAKFKFIKGQYFEIPRYPDPAVDCGNGEKTTASHNEDGLPKVWTHIPTIWLQDVRTNQTIIVINTHNVANVKGAEGTRPAKSRYKSALIYIEQIQQLKQENPGIPIFFTGDFNEGTDVRDSNNVTWQGKQENLLFCMFAQNKLMISVTGPAMKCDPSYSIGGVDYIYATPGVIVDWHKEIASGGANSGPPSFTDHPVKYAKLTIPGTGRGSGGGDINNSLPSKDGWSWPIKPSESKPGPCYGGSSVHAGLDINSNSNSTVYAMAKGKVVTVINGIKGYSSGTPTGNHIMIKTNDGVYYGYQHLLNGSIRVKKDDVVQAKQVLAKMGATGNVRLGSSKAHLHITMARTNTTGSYGNLSTTFNPLSILNGVKPSQYSCY